MINQNNQKRYRSDKHFIIDISFILPSKLKKFIISLFISDNLKVQELKEFISKDFDIPINTFKFFYPLEGFLDDSYEFPFEQDKKINLDLILNEPKESAFDFNRENVSKKEENRKKINENKLNKKNEIKSSVTRIDDFFKRISQNQEIENAANVKKENNLLNNKSLLNNSINSSINEKNRTKDAEKKEEVKKNFSNFYLTKINDKDKGANHIFLNKKRFDSSHKSFKTQNKKNSSKIEIKNNKNIKIINFNINKSLGGFKINKSS